MFLTHEQSIVSESVAYDFDVSETGVTSRHGFEETIGVNEREESDSLPEHLLSVHIDVERVGIEVFDR